MHITASIELLQFAIVLPSQYVTGLSVAWNVIHTPLAKFIWGDINNLL